VLDGHFGNHNALHMARQCGLHLISKLRCDAALYFPYRGPYAGRGPHRKYGPKVDYDHLPVPYLKETTVEGHIETRLYQMQLLHKEFAQPLNVVIIAKTNLRTQARAHVVLFSSDLALAYTYCLSSFAPPLYPVTLCCISRFQRASPVGMPFQGGEKMTPTWAQRREALWRDCIVSPDVFHQMVERLGDFVVP